MRVAEKILVLDDNAPLVTAIRGILEREGYEVVTLLLRTIEDVEGCKPHLVVIDAPPGKKGATVNFVQCLRLHPPTARLPVMIMTTSFKTAEASLLRERGIHVINKPFELEDFLNSVAALLRHGRATSASND
jgi:DNA-binding response OmpR family regulator